VITSYVEYQAPAEALPPEIHAYSPPLAQFERQHRKRRHIHRTFHEPCKILHHSAIRRKMTFPESRLIQYDCGKLQVMDRLLRNLKDGGHRVLIFTQMSKMLNTLESFLNIYNYRYLRLDGSTKTEDRGKLMHRFNQDDKIFAFILSTRSGGLGMNLTGADTVIFYDNDWNPAMDMQAQDRCHRIGQTREVHIYKLMCKNTIEENILRKAQKKMEIMSAVMDDGAFNLDSFRDLDPWEILGLEAKADQEKLSAEQIKQAMEQAEDFEDREAATKVAKENQMGVGVIGSDEYLERSRFETAIGILNPVEKYSLSFFGKDHRPDLVIEIAVQNSELQCRQLESRLINDMRFLREMNYLHKGQELTNNANTELTLNKNITSGVNYHDVLKLAQTDFKKEGFLKGDVTLLVKDDNLRDWGIFTTPAEIAMMIPKPKAQRKGPSSSGSNSKSAVKAMGREEAMNLAIQVDDSLNIHIPWTLLPRRKQPPNSQKPPKNIVRGPVRERQSRGPQRRKHKKQKDPIVQFNPVEQKWFREAVKRSNANPELISLQIMSNPQFKWKQRVDLELIKKKISEIKDGTFDFKKSDALDMLSYETIMLNIQDNRKLNEIQDASQAHLNDNFTRSKSKMKNNAYETLMQKAKARVNPGGQHSGITNQLTPKTLLMQIIHNDDIRRQHFGIMRHHPGAGSAAAHRAARGQHVLQQQHQIMMKLAESQSRRQFLRLPPNQMPRMMPRGYHQTQ